MSCLVFGDFMSPNAWHGECNLQGLQLHAQHCKLPARRSLLLPAVQKKISWAAAAAAAQENLMHSTLIWGSRRQRRASLNVQMLLRSYRAVRARSRRAGAGVGRPAQGGKPGSKLGCVRPRVILIQRRICVLRDRRDRCSV